MTSALAMRVSVALLLPVVGTDLILLAGVHPANPVSRVLGERPLAARMEASV